jgi:hypothetical protein
LSADRVPDLLRVAALILGVASVGTAAVVSVAYYGAWRRERQRAKRTGMPWRWRGLLPLHVWLVGTSHSTLVLATMAEMMMRLRDELTWRPFVYGVAYALSAYAMWTVLGHERARAVSKAPDTSDDPIERPHGRDH